MQKILITTGGTGGHVIPAQIIKEHLEDDFKVFFSTDIRGLKYFSSHIDRTIIIDTPKFNLSFYLPYRIIKLIYLIFKAIFLLRKKEIYWGMWEQQQKSNPNPLTEPLLAENNFT